MAAALERSYIEICGFEREAERRPRELTANLGNTCTSPARRCRRLAGS